MPPRPTVFISYSHRDSRWLKRLQVHLKPFGRRGDLVIWDDTKIDPGDQWRASIRAAVESAAASILLISADFLASDFVTSEELPALLARSQRDGARVIPIVVQPCRLAHHPELAAFQTLNPPDQPLSRLTEAEAEEVFVRATEELAKALRAPRPVRKGRRSADRHVASEEDQASDDLYKELQLPVMAISVLAALHGAPNETGMTMTELTRSIEAVSRKLVYDAVDRLLKAGWIDKQRASQRTSYRVAGEGVRQLKRLGASAEGPVRRVLPQR